MSTPQGSPHPTTNPHRVTARHLHTSHTEPGNRIDGVRLYYPGGDVEHVTPQVRADVHAAITISLERDWPPYIQGLIDRGALQTR
ncbi:hypothetical protein ACFU8Q_06085 [Streptomyces sp. NPDC057543]|uniref:hypothetical protein n=1 Tax=Streptomyces sp. NPDC057543 TaxID=3346163 RepID=UPI00369E7BBB